MSSSDRPADLMSKDLGYKCFAVEDGNWGGITAARIRPMFFIGLALFGAPLFISAATSRKVE